jgi:hypothetical protein
MPTWEHDAKVGRANAGRSHNAHRLVQLRALVVALGGAIARFKAGRKPTGRADPVPVLPRDRDLTIGAPRAAPEMMFRRRSDETIFKSLRSRPEMITG